jgi:hypothetical protein
MTEQEIKTMCKLAVEYSNHPLTDLDKELLKQAIDKAKHPVEILTAFSAILSTK